MKKKILLLENDDATADAITELLQTFGCYAECIRARTVNETVRIIRELGRPSALDVVLLSYQLPDGFGTELMETFRKVYSQCRVIVISDLMDDPDATRIIKRQAPDFMLSKPFTVDSFQQMLRSIGLI